MSQSRNMCGYYYQSDKWHYFEAHYPVDLICVWHFDLKLQCEQKSTSAVNNNIIMVSTCLIVFSSSGSCDEMEFTEEQRSELVKVQMFLIQSDEQAWCSV